MGLARCIVGAALSVLCACETYGGGGAFPVLSDGRFTPQETSWVRDGDGYTNPVSGLRCPATRPLSEGLDPLPLVEVTAYRPDDLDTSCTYGLGRAGTIMTTYATYAPEVSGDSYFEESVAALRRAYATRGEVSLRDEVVGSSRARSVGLITPPDGAIAYDRIQAIWTVPSCGWHLKVRATYPADLAAAEQIAGELLRDMHDDLPCTTPPVGG